MIENLPHLTPSTQRGARTIARCHERLARQRKRRERRGPSARYLAVERALIVGFCVIYFSGIALVAIRMLSAG
jgi:hypothetical protein